jgi:hypothetical protein
MQSLVKSPSRQSVLPCKVDYFNDKLMTDGARLARSVWGQKDARKVAVLPGDWCVPATAKEQYAGIRNRVEGRFTTFL